MKKRLYSRMLKKLSSFFSKEEVIGLDIGDSYISASYIPNPRGDFSSGLEYNDKLEVENIGWVEKEEGASKKEVASSIRKLWRKYNISTYTVSSCLRSPLLVLKYFKYPNIRKKDLASTLKLEAEQIFKKPQNELLIDWWLAPFSENNPKHNIPEGVLIVVTQEEIEKHFSILKLAGLYPIIVDVGCMALSNAFLKLKNPPDDTVNCIINVSSFYVDIVVLSGHSYIYPQTLYSKTAPWREKMDYLIKNLKDIFRYYKFRFGHRGPIEKFIFTGSVPFYKTFQKEIESAFDIPVEFWNPLDDINLVRNVPDDEVNTYGPMMGASIGVGLCKFRR